jgi:hypothetical protein
MEERRRSLRVPTSLPARCYRIRRDGELGESFTAEVVDLSGVGYAFITEDDLEPGIRVYVELTLPGGEEVTGDATVARVGDDERGRFYGVDISAMENAGATRITAFAFSETRRRQSPGRRAAA